MSTQPKPFVFVLMPFEKEYDDIYALGIKAACADAGGYCERVDEQLFEGSILDRIYNQISKADLIVADMSGRNANVFYEVGYAHALGKRVVLLTKDPNDIPFDLKHQPHIVYGGRITDLKDELLRRVAWAFSNPQVGAQDPAPSYEFLIEGAPLTSDSVVDVYSAKQQINSLTFVLGVHRLSGGSSGMVSLNLGIIAPHQFFGSKANKGRLPTKVMRMRDGTYLHLLSDAVQLLPGAYDNIEFQVYGSKLSIEEGEVTSLLLRLMYPEGIVDLPFQLRTNRRSPALRA
jgi:hypothetical protein